MFITNDFIINRKVNFLQVLRISPNFIVYFDQGTVGPTELDRFEGVPFVKHQCGSHCIQNPHYQYKENQMRGTNPLLIPIGLFNIDKFFRSYLYTAAKSIDSILPIFYSQHQAGNAKYVVSETMVGALFITLLLVGDA